MKLALKIGGGLWVALLLAGCMGDEPTKNAPAARGAGGVPLLSEAQISKLPPEKQEQIRQSQQMMQQAASSNLQRKQTGQMPNGAQ